MCIQHAHGAYHGNRYSHGDALINGALYVFGGRLLNDPPHVERMQDRVSNLPPDERTPSALRPLNLQRCRNDLWRLDLATVRIVLVRLLLLLLLLLLQLTAAAAAAAAAVQLTATYSSSAGIAAIATTDRCWYYDCYRFVLAEMAIALHSRRHTVMELRHTGTATSQSIV